MSAIPQPAIHSQAVALNLTRFRPKCVFGLVKIFVMSGPSIMDVAFLLFYLYFNLFCLTYSIISKIPSLVIFTNQQNSKSLIRLLAFRIFLNPHFRHPHTDPVYDFLDLLLRINFRPSVNLRSDFISDQDNLKSVGLLFLWHTINWNTLKTGRNLPQNFIHTLHPPTTPTITNLNVYFRQFF